MFERIIRMSAVLAAVMAPVCGQVWDTSGNNLLHGTYYFREVVYSVGDNAGDLQDAAAVYGTMTFSGTGTYTLNGSFAEFQAGSVQPFTASGTYKISASGFGFLSSVVSSSQLIYGAVSANGIFIGSSTEAGYNDFLVAAPLASPLPNLGTLQGSYTAMYFNSPGVGSSGGVQYAYDAMLQFSSNGAGTIGTVQTTGYIGTSTTPFSVSETNVRYITSNGAEVVTFPNGNNNPITGQQYIYMSPDGSFIFGGSPVGFDFLIGVRNGSTAPAVGGFYYQAGIDQDQSGLSSGYGLLDTFYGSFTALSSGDIIGHRRVFAPLTADNAYNYTYSDSFPAGTTGNYTNKATYTTFIAGGGGIVIGMGLGPYLGLSIAVPAQSFSGSGVYIYPNGIVNAASSAPFTTGIAPGELITIYGQNLAPGNASAPIPFPTTLNTVQVLINGNAVPVYVVSPTQISAQVPFGLTGTTAQIQVMNNGTLSNAITEFVYQTQPGVFTINPGGLGRGAILHADYTLVSADHPATAGETVLLFATGLGSVFPVVGDGAAAPTSTLSNTVATITANIGGSSATVSFAGLAPGFAGLYQLNVVIPTGLTTGDYTLNIGGPDSFSGEALIPIG
jgi:uncharacterized protein (TIGR03437 family)